MTSSDRAGIPSIRRVAAPRRRRLRALFAIAPHHQILVGDKKILEFQDDGWNRRRPGVEWAMDDEIARQVGSTRSSSSVETCSHLRDRAGPRRALVKQTAGFLPRLRMGRHFKLAVYPTSTATGAKRGTP